MGFNTESEFRILVPYFFEVFIFEQNIKEYSYAYRHIKRGS